LLAKRKPANSLSFFLTESVRKRTNELSGGAARSLHLMAPRRNAGMKAREIHKKTP
jgi:hypothetical protein